MTIDVGKSKNSCVSYAKNGDAYDVGCVCVFNFNIGNNLTNFALYKTLIDIGYYPLMIGCPKKYATITGGDDTDRFRRFKNNPYEKWAIQDILECKEDLVELNRKCDFFVVGSDQLWRGIFMKDLDYYTALNWVSGTKYKMSYATSLGQDSLEIDNFDINRMKYYLNRFNRVSVREKSGCNLLEQLLGKTIKMVLDPVFLCDSKVYEDMVNKASLNTKKDRYVAAYFLDKTRNKEEILMKISNEITGGRYLAATDYPEEEFKNSIIDYIREPYIEEWIAMVRDSEIFLTDSFHGICFAIIFHKEFGVIYDKDNWRGYTRIQGILERYNLQDRFVDDSSCVSSLLTKKINWMLVDEKIKKDRMDSLQWLREGLEEGKKYLGEYDVYDEIIVREVNNYYGVKKSIDKHELEDVHSRTNEMIKEIRGELFALKHEKCLNVEKNVLRKEIVEVVGFGAGNCFSRYAENLCKVTNFRYVCDNDPLKWGTVLMNGITCISPRKLSEMRDVLVVIMVDDIGASFEIANQLMNLGISSFTHIVNWIREINK